MKRRKHTVKKWTLTLIVLAMALTLTVAAVAEESPDGLHASIQHTADSPAWVVNLPAALDETVTQLFVVAGLGMDKTTATISMHQRDEAGNWKQILSTPGFVGLNGLCLDADHREGCAQTPIGVYHFNKAFGIAADPGCAIPYFQVDDNTYWSAILTGSTIRWWTSGRFRTSSWTTASTSWIMNINTSTA